MKFHILILSVMKSVAIGILNMKLNFLFSAITVVRVLTCNITIKQRGVYNEKQKTMIIKLLVRMTHC